MTNGLQQRVRELLNKVEQAEKKTTLRITQLLALSKELIDATHDVFTSWSGSFLGYHSELYYGDFQKPPLGSRFNPEWGGVMGLPSGWKPRTPEEVKAKIERIAKAKFEDVDRETASCRDELKEVRDEVAIGLSTLRSLSGFEKEKALLEEVENFQPEKKAAEFMNAGIPSTFMFRDTGAMSQGIRVPAYLYYEGLAYEYRSRCLAAQEFPGIARRLLRQLDVRLADAGLRGTTPSDAIETVNQICSRFHLVAKQLQQRHNARPTLSITDEYDVQDLLHGLLRLHFDDVRPEEWTPSYAGGAARMDFLLKAEETAVEAKMTRKGRGAKEVSDELIVDATRYKEHGNCKTLVCFIYDPEGQIKNPRGIESDLAKLSDSRLRVIAIIST